MRLTCDQIILPHDRTPKLSSKQGKTVTFWQRLCRRFARFVRRGEIPSILVRYVEGIYLRVYHRSRVSHKVNDTKSVTSFSISAADIDPVLVPVVVVVFPSVVDIAYSCVCANGLDNNGPVGEKVMRATKSRY